MINISVLFVLLLLFDLLIAPLFINQNFLLNFFKSHRFSGNIQQIQIPNVKLKRKRFFNLEAKSFCADEKSSKWCASFSELRYRITDTEVKNRDKVAIFLGGSFVFGDSLEDKETLPFYFQKLLEDYKVYNFGYRGGSIHHFFELLLSGTINHLIEGKEVLILYGNYQDHYVRVNGGLGTCCHSFGPRFKTTKDGLVYQGEFKDVIVSELPLYLFSISNSLRALLSYENLYSKLVYELVDKKNLCSILEGIEHTLESKNLKKLQIVSYSYCSNHGIYCDISNKHITGCSARIGAEYIDLYRFFTKIPESQQFIESNGHPTATLNRELAAFLLANLKNRKIIE